MEFSDRSVTEWRFLKCDREMIKACEKMWQGKRSGGLRDNLKRDLEGWGARSDGGFEVLCQLSVVARREDGAKLA